MGFENSISTSKWSHDLSTSGLATAILDFWLPVAFNIVLHSSGEKLDPVIERVPFEISTLASMESKIHRVYIIIHIKYNLRFASAILDYWMVME